MTEEKEAPPAPETAAPEARPAEPTPDAPPTAETAAPEHAPAEEVVSVPDDLPAGDGGDDKPRRVRARRAIAKPPEEDKPRERKPRERKPRERRPPRGEGRKGDEAAPVGASPMRRARVYKQDPVDGIVPGPPPPEPTPEEIKAKKIKDQTQTTLILHPAPKAGGHVKKKNKAPKTAKEVLAAKTKAKGKGNKKKDKKEPKADVKLDQSWIGADAEGAVEALQAAGAAAEKLVKAWVDGDNLAAIAGGAASEELSGKSRKAVRRAASVLRSRGVELPEVATATPATETETADEPVANFVPPDATGTMFISISQRQPGGRYLVADCVARHGVGVVRASQGRLAGKQIRAWKERIEKDYGAQPVEIPLDWARARIEEAKETNAKSGAIMPLGFDSCAVLFQPVPEEAPPHPVEDLVEAEPDAAVLEEASTDSQRLHSYPEFRSWMPDKNSIDELLAKVGETVGSEEAASDPKKVNEALKAEVGAATDRFFTPELRQAVAAWMKDAAIGVRSREGDDEAQHVLRVAKAVEQAGLITSPPNEIPFLQTFFQKAIAHVVSQNQGQLRVPVPGAQPQV